MINAKVIASEERILPVVFSESVQGFAINTGISEPVLSVEAEPVTEDAFFIPKRGCEQAAIFQSKQSIDYVKF